ncbi:MAG: hypothetical protein LBS02_07670 [Hungatella sp.]|nr:hypothetical protein [Hungatella sp.]
MMADQNEMVKIITPMMEHICDKLCRFPWEITDKEEMSRICHECKMNQYEQEIKDTYNATDQLQAAAEVVRAEFMKKGDWYNALVVSIHGYFYDMDKAMAPWEVAKGLADRIAGIEPEAQRT